MKDLLIPFCKIEYGCLIKWATGMVGMRHTQTGGIQVYADITNNSMCGLDVFVLFSILKNTAICTHL